MVDDLMLLRGVLMPEFVMLLRDFVMLMRNVGMAEFGVLVRAL